jgi:hypothetical protein
MVAMKLDITLRIENRCEVERSSRDSGSILSSPKEDERWLAQRLFARTANS